MYKKEPHNTDSLYEVVVMSYYKNLKGPDVLDDIKCTRKGHGESIKHPKPPRTPNGTLK